MSINIKFFIKKDNQWFYYKVLCDLSMSNFVNFNGGKNWRMVFSEIASPRLTSCFDQKGGFVSSS